MKVHSAWLAVGLFLFLVLGCKFGNTNTTNTNTSTNGNSSAPTAGTSTGRGEFTTELHMAKDNGSGDPGDESSTFGPTDRTIHAVTKLKDSKSGTKMKFAWWIVDADGARNQKIRDIDYTTRALENVVHGHLTLPRDWPKGSYKVDLYVNDVLDRTVQFTVE
ncbi:MAG TPA: hypothetical protein VIB00_09520 [Pyrinomonadaceae bacterium]